MSTQDAPAGAALSEERQHRLEELIELAALVRLVRRTRAPAPA